MRIRGYSRGFFTVTCLIICIFLSGCGRREVLSTFNVQDTSSMVKFLPVIPAFGIQAADVNRPPMITMLPMIPLNPSISPIPTLTLAPTLVPTVTPTITPTPTVTPAPTPVVREVTLVAVGDDLLHQKAIESGLKEDGSYNFDHLFEHLKEDFTGADIAVINQETIFGTKEMGYSGYPRFCSPTQVGDAIRRAGFDVVLHATNHVADRGIEGIENTLAYWSQHPDITVIGIHDSLESYRNITVIEKEGIKIALLNYTYGTNGLTLPSDKFYVVNDFNEQNITEDIKKAKEIADFIIVFPHWGSEYVYKKNEFQKLWTNFFAEQGVDLVIGAHPHVLQPVEWITSSSGHQMLVYYSLGNYVSTMDYTDRMLGGMADITIAKDNTGTYIKDAHIIPIVTHYERGYPYNLCVYKLSEYTKELAGKHYILRNYRGKDFSIDKLNQLAQDIVGAWIKE